MPNFIYAALSETVPAQLELVYYVITIGAHIVIVVVDDYDNEHQMNIKFNTKVIMMYTSSDSDKHFLQFYTL